MLIEKQDKDDAPVNIPGISGAEASFGKDLAYCCKKDAARRYHWYPASITGSLLRLNR
jgi:hypothetical protein